MKKLAVVIALVLALSPAASALTFTAQDVGIPEFQWGSYPLTLSLFTDESGEMDYVPYPANGSLAMVRLASTGGQIALEDIRAGAKRFLLRDATGAVNETFVWHVGGTTVENGSNVSNPLQNAFDLVYFLPEGVPLEGATLLLRDSDGSERTLLQLPGTAQEPANVEPSPEAQPEPTAQPEPSAQPEPAQEPSQEPQPGLALQPEPTEEASPDQEAADFIGRLLSEEAENAEDPWTIAILEAGAENVSLQDGKISFALRSFNPGLKSIGETEPAEFLSHLYRNASAYDLACTLDVTEDGGLAATGKARKALVKAVEKAAGQSRKAFDDKKVRVALAGYLLGNRGMEDLDYEIPLGDFAPLFAAQSKQTLSVKDGPHALNLGTTGVKGEDLLQKGYAAALLRLSKLEGSKDLEQSEIAPIFLEELSAQASALKKKGAEKCDFVINIDDLLSPEYPYAGDDFNAFVYDFSDAYSEKLYELEYAVASFPDYPAVDYPKSGRVSGSKSGTKVVFKIPGDGAARFIQMRKVDSGELAVSAFLRPGQSATVRVPKGKYYILIASGEIWYGEQHLFGDNGSYSRTEDLQIKGSSYYHVITLGGVENGNMSSYGSDPSEFQ